MAGNTDLKAHVASYDRMIGMMKWGSVGVAIVVGIVIWLIAA
ncbi:aa3-type cytochrome c oxidase subunit IV [Sphingomonas sp. Leaf343]|nr:aa3-type cytochrome c oxidase subunit IV [Sphingomonas sp. Leaf343]